MRIFLSINTYFRPSTLAVLTPEQMEESRLGGRRWSMMLISAPWNGLISSGYDPSAAQKLLSRLIGQIIGPRLAAITDSHADPDERISIIMRHTEVLHNTPRAGGGILLS